MKGKTYSKLIKVYIHTTKALTLTLRLQCLDPENESNDKYAQLFMY